MQPTWVEVVNALAVVVLVLVTIWYAYSTSRMVAEMRRQLDLLNAQAALQAKAGEVSAQAALLQAAGHPVGHEPIPRLRQLADELRTAAAKASEHVVK